MTDKQISAIKCAYLDLVGAYQAFKQMDVHSHDWQAHINSFVELELLFPDIIEPIDVGENDDEDWDDTEED